VVSGTIFGLRFRVQENNKNLIKINYNFDVFLDILS
jgi:hypothetical protein